MFSVEELFRKEITSLKPYKPIFPFEVLAERLGRPPEEIVKLDANENPYGPSPKVLEALAHYPYYYTYPDPQATRLREALSGYVGVPMEHIFVGNGADEIITLVSRLFLNPGDAIVILPPTFGMYEFNAALQGARVVSVPRPLDTFSVDVGAVVKAVENTSPTPKLLFLVTPNNPDGGISPPEVVERLLELPLVVVVDEAYNEFSGEPSFARRVLERDNLVVVRTFSKWAGLAGLRLGYGIFPEVMTQVLWRMKEPYNVNAAAMAAGLAALEDVDYARRMISAIVAERDRLFDELGRIPGLHPFPSRANFILCHVTGMEAHRLRDALVAEGIVIRYYDNPDLEDYIRVTVGRPEQNDRLLCALWRALG